MYRAVASGCGTQGGPVRRPCIALVEPGLKWLPLNGGSTQSQGGLLLIRLLISSLLGAGVVAVGVVTFTHSSAVLGTYLVQVQL